MNSQLPEKTITAVDLRQAAAAFLLAQFKLGAYGEPHAPEALIQAASHLVQQL